MGNTDNLMKLIHWLKSSFDEHTSGASAKKWTAFVFVWATIYLEIKFSTPISLEAIVIINLTFVASLLGMSTFKDPIAERISKGKKDEPESTPEK